MSSTRSAPAAQSTDHMCPRHTAIDSLLVRTGDGDSDAFAAFYDLVGPTVYAMSVGSGHGPRIAAEVTYDVFDRTWRQARTYDPEAASAWTWLRAIARESINSRRTERSAAAAEDAPDTSGRVLAASSDTATSQLLPRMDGPR